ncbi:MAG: CoA-binding protein [Deltaproteobacteria bacterium]|nr:CoA-binding protein [Deltaproteobacteria bacterium]
MNDAPKLDFLFSPKSVAVVLRSRGLGAFFLKQLLDGGFQGQLYAVCGDADELMGLPCYRSVTDIPGPVDYVIIAVSANQTPDVIRNCALKGVKACTLFTAGFSELGTDEGIALEREIVSISRGSGMRLIGPNCMGIYAPGGGLYFSANLPRVRGWFGVSSQSGGNAIYLGKMAPRRGAPISKAVSYGNACDINESDLIEYLADDEETTVIGAYIEGIKDGKRFREVLKRAARKKPTIILKGGQTEAGAAVTQSHTASLSGSLRIWDAVITQSGAIQAESLDEMIDLALLFGYMKPPAGRRIGMVGIGGGVSVLAADAFEQKNLSLTRLTPAIQARLQDLHPGAGNIYTNPIDTTALFYETDGFRKTLEILDDWDEIDIILLHVPYDILAFLTPEQVRGIAMAEKMIGHIGGIRKPVAMLLHCAALKESYELSCDNQEVCWKAGLPAFTSIEGCASALDKFIRFHERKTQRG